MAPSPEAPIYGLVFAVLCGITPDGVMQQELSASFTPAQFAAGSGKESKSCICDVEVHEADLSALTALFDAAGVAYDIFGAEPPSQTVVIDCGLVSVPRAIDAVRALLGGVILDWPQYFCALDGNVAGYPGLVIFDKRTHDKPLITIRQNLSDGGGSVPAPTRFEGQRWYECKRRLARSGLFVPNMLLLEDPDGDDDDHDGFFALSGVLTVNSSRDFGATLTAIVQQFPKD